MRVLTLGLGKHTNAPEHDWAEIVHARFEFREARFVPPNAKTDCSAELKLLASGQVFRCHWTENPLPDMNTAIPVQLLRFTPTDGSDIAIAVRLRGQWPPVVFAPHPDAGILFPGYGTPTPLLPGEHRLLVTVRARGIATISQEYRLLVPSDAGERMQLDLVQDPQLLPWYRRLLPGRRGPTHG